MPATRAAAASACVEHAVARDKDREGRHRRRRTRPAEARRTRKGDQPPIGRLGDCGRDILRRVEDAGQHVGAAEPRRAPQAIAERRGEQPGQALRGGRQRWLDVVGQRFEQHLVRGAVGEAVGRDAVLPLHHADHPPTIGAGVIGKRFRHAHAAHRHNRWYAAARARSRSARAAPRPDRGSASPATIAPPRRPAPASCRANGTGEAGVAPVRTTCSPPPADSCPPAAATRSAPTGQGSPPAAHSTAARTSRSARSPRSAHAAHRDRGRAGRSPSSYLLQNDIG
ncbi:hypothetical protein WR25_21027 [Diploscapter pachys]|uniref:Uncharacterized protein n=1 Tax=Diploscapter pachys TaxID=2018661 RepID=A0A2A2KG99_9BILA|nr:hypothetical protein WR25_21027 [Diploscapter pachys]